MRKSVLILGHNYATQFIDVYNQYTRIFNRDQFEVTVAYLTGAASEEVRRRTLAERVVFFDLPNRDLRYLKIGAIQKLKSFCQQNACQIVVCHRYKPTYIMLWVAQFLSIPALVCVMHELRTMRAIRRKLIIAALSQKPQNVLFAGVSDAVTEDLRKSLWGIKPDHITTLYNMIDVDLTAPLFLDRAQARAELNLGEQDFIFGNIARLAPNKDQESLISAFRQVHQHNPHCKLLIMGDGALEKQLKNQVKSQGLESAVIFTGFVPQGFRYMRAFDCFVLSSIQEAFGRVLLEAMLADVPVIATAVNGIPEVVGDSGMLIKPKTPESLASAMEQLLMLSANERQAKGHQGKTRVLQHFSIPQFEQQFWQIPSLLRIKGH